MNTSAQQISEEDNLYKRSNRFLWSLLAFQGGLVNVESFKAFSNFVSHVTGDFGHLAISITRFSIEDSLIWLIIPTSFLFGSITSGFSTSAKKIKGHLPQYFHLVFLMSFCYALIVTFYQLQVFNLPLGSHYKVVDIFSIILLSYACGIQNALFTSASGAVVRTTHLTGLTTDLGIGIANYFSKKYDRKEGRSNKLRFTLIFSFTFGGIVGSVAFDYLKYNSFLLPAIISFIMGARLLYTGRKWPGKNQAS